jgi:uncharacterized membrane protein
MSMEVLYHILQKVGYDHPVHPPITHIPIGLVIAVFIFGCLSLILRRELLPAPAYRRINILALLFVLPTILLGYTDWMYFYRGAWSFPIIVKFILSGIFLVLLIIVIRLNRRNETQSGKVVLVYGLCVISVTGLGFYGGEIVFMGTEKEYPLSESLSIGEKVYAQSCAPCHPSAKVLAGTRPLSDFDSFLSFTRDPRKPDGSPVPMPAFSADKLPDCDAIAVFRYISVIALRQVSGSARPATPAGPIKP